VPVGPKSSACFERVYDAAHLAAHRRQKTTAVLPSLSRDLEVGGEFAMRLRLDRRDRKAPFLVVGYCGRYPEDPSAPASGAEERARRDRGLICMARGGLGGGRPRRAGSSRWKPVDRAACAEMEAKVRVDRATAAWSHPSP
jgi:hypothetical protein